MLWGKLNQNMGENDRGRVDMRSLSQVVEEGSSHGVALEWKPEGNEKKKHADIGGKSIRTQGTASTKVLRKEHSWFVRDT